jgi:hypothetical protein
VRYLLDTNVWIKDLTASPNAIRPHLPPKYQARQRCCPSVRERPPGKHLERELHVRPREDGARELLGDEGAFVATGAGAQVLAGRASIVRMTRIMLCIHLRENAGNRPLPGYPRFP